jgi:hypothetical protein
MGLTHFALDFSLRNQSSDRIDHNDINRIAANEDFSNLKGLFPIVRLADQQVFRHDTQFPRVLQVESVLRIHEGRQPATFLCFCDDMQGQRGFARRLGSKDFNNSSSSYPANPQCQIERQATRGNDRNLNRLSAFSQSHDGAFSTQSFNLRYGCINGFLTFICGCHSVGPRPFV